MNSVVHALVDSLPLVVRDILAHEDARRCRSPRMTTRSKHFSLIDLTNLSAKALRFGERGGNRTGSTSALLRIMSNAAVMPGEPSTRPSGQPVPPTAVSRRRLPLFFGRLLQYPRLEHFIGGHLLEFRILVFQLPKPLRIGQFHPTIFPAPTIEGLFADVGLPADLFHGLASIGQAQNTDNLLGLVSLSFHVRILGFRPES